MIILDESSADKALAAIFLLYKDIITENGTFCTGTAVLDAFFSEFNGYDFLNCSINEEYHVCSKTELKLIHEGAVIYLLCDLSDSMGMYEKHIIYREILANLSLKYGQYNLSHFLAINYFICLG